jgi:hypothetical protein
MLDCFVFPILINAFSRKYAFFNGKMRLKQCQKKNLLLKTFFEY